MHHFQSHVRSATTVGLFLMLASAFNFAVLDILVKLLDPSFRVWEIAFYRFLCSLLILTTVFGWRHNPFKGHNPKLMVLNGIISSIGFVALVTAIRLINISTAMGLFYSFPAFAALFSTLIFRESVRKEELFYVLIALCGVMILFEFRLGGSLIGQVMGLLAGISIGLSVAIVRKLREKEGSVVIYLYYCLVGSVVTFPPFIANPQIPRVVEEWLIFAGIIFSSIFAMLLMNKGFRYCKSWEGGLILTNELIFTAIFGIVFLKELLTCRFLIGGLLILGSVVALNLSNIRKPSRLTG